MEAGLYNDGLVTVFDQEYDDSFLQSWSWLIGNNVILVGATCWGDFFYIDMNDYHFYIVLADQDEKVLMGNSFVSVFDKNLAVEKFQKAILRPEVFDSFKQEFGSLEYGELYMTNVKGVRSKRNLSVTLAAIGKTEGGNILLF